jgi:hypothetical protein
MVVVSAGGRSPYVLCYTGPHADEVDGISFLEGNSNLGDTGPLAKSG